MRKRLFLRVYLTILAAVVLVLLAAAAAWHTVEHARAEHVIDAVAEFLAERLPPATAAAIEQARALEALNRRLRVDVALFAADGSLIAQAGRPIPPALSRRGMAGPMGPSRRPAWSMALADGRWFAARLPPPPWRPGVALAGFAVVLGLAVAAGAWPVARGLTGRLERLRAGVEQFGQGDASVRVAVEGQDEIAALATSFNQAAGRIAALLDAHRMLLANASHELRTPLARIRMALELAGESIPPARRAQLRADIAELDQLIGEILLTSSLDAGSRGETDETVDLLALVAEEAAREGCEVHGTPALVRGDPLLLRRMVRNLIENARRHGGDQAPDIAVGRSDGAALLDVRDHGPGVPGAEREKIFAPFYRLAGRAEDGRGSGLGLALVRRIAERHGGSAVCLPAEPGCLFRVRLPEAGANR